MQLGHVPTVQLIMECSMLITDYSSVCWDVLYMDKPVVFYQFDQERYENEVGSYIDLNKDLPGKVCFGEEELIVALQDIVDANYELDEDARVVARQWFDFKDKNNRKRTYEFLIDEKR